MESVQRAAQEFGTPLYLFRWEPVANRLASLATALQGLPVRHWYSFKTCPLPTLLSSWKRCGHGVEVVSDFELLGALQIGFSPEQILVNGVAKHLWLPKHELNGLRVNFDSVAEAEAIAPIARKRQWRIGVRLHPPSQNDPDDARFPDQFGMTETDARAATDVLHAHSLQPLCVHMHLRSNVTASHFRDGLEELIEMIGVLGLHPTALDLGGGLFAPGIDLHGGRNDLLTPTAVSEVIRCAWTRLPDVTEFWMENGRFLLAPSGVLVVRVNDIKTHAGVRMLLCDGGRTNHALVSDWETHSISVLPARGGERVPTILCGPTCMAYDQLCRRAMPADIQAGDLLVWHDAGAYHLPWETRFSHGLAPVIFIDSDESLNLVRPRETFCGWWSQWSQTRI